MFFNKSIISISLSFKICDWSYRKRRATSCFPRRKD